MGVDNLPVELSSFIGREEELEKVHALLDAHRLVTLTGTGGSGKTRLAIRLARRSQVGVRDMYFVDLQATTDPAMVDRAVADAVGMTEQPMQSAVDAVASRIGNRDALLLLDNCEHLIETSADVARGLLAACPNLKVLATSRQPLAVDGEIAFRVGPLPVPDRDDDPTCPSVRLFIDRALAVRQDFQHDAGGLAATARICRELDGLPLAIELAATRCNAMSPGEIADQLHDRFRLLRTGPRNAVARQRTLEASVAWSFDLLEDVERTVLRRVSVFAGGFTAAGASAVNDGLDHAQVVNTLASLVDRSLVGAEELRGRTRFRLLESIRAFAGTRLMEAGEASAARNGHLAHMVALAESVEQDLYFGAHRNALAELMPDVENLKLALGWAAESGNTDAALRLFAASGNFWSQMRPADGHSWGQRLETLIGGSHRDRGLSLTHAALCAWAVGDLAAVARFTAGASQIAEALDDPLLRAAAADNAGRYLIQMGDTSGFEVLDTAAAEASRLGNSVIEVGSRVTAAMGLAFAGQVQEATARSRHVLDLCDRAGDHLALGIAMHIDAFIALVRGDFALADANVRFMETAPSSTQRFGRFFAEVLPPWLLSAAGKHEDAVALLDERLSSARRFSNFPVLAFGGWLMAWVSWRAGLVTDEATLEAAQGIAGMAGAHFAAPVVAALRAEQALDEGDLERAIRYATEARGLVTTTPLGRLFAPLTLNTSARVALAGGGVAEAEATAREALGKYLGEGMRWGVPEALETLASVYDLVGERRRAATVLGASAARREAIGWAPGVREQRQVMRLRQSLRDALGADLDAASLEGATLLDEDLLVHTMGRRRDNARPIRGWDSLTRAERDVAGLAAAGLRNNEIAARLFVSPGTVKTHLAHVFGKIGVRSRAELAARAGERLGPIGDLGQTSLPAPGE
jgi:predicted ATPase/DNA-binding CsgD family transcriptional regulator